MTTESEFDIVTRFKEIFATQDKHNEADIPVPIMVIRALRDRLSNTSGKQKK